MERHGTDIFDLVKEQEFLTKQEIIDLTKSSFGSDVTFYTCAQSGISPEALLDFFIANNKFEERDGKFRFFCQDSCN